MNIKKKVYTVIKKINPKNKLTNADIELIFEYFEYFSFTKNSELKKNNMAILILEGNIARYENEKLLENLHSPVLLREGNLINQMTHKHKIIPTTAGYGFYIDKDRYVTFQFEHPEISLLFIDLILNSTNLIMNSKITNNNKKNILKKISLFKVFNNEEILKIIEKSKIEYFKYGEKIIQKGQDVNYAYIIIFGEAVDSQNVSKTNGEDRLLTVGDIINAKALFGDSNSEKTVIANNDVKVLKIANTTFSKLINQNYKKLNESVKSLLNENDSKNKVSSREQSHIYCIIPGGQTIQKNINEFINEALKETNIKLIHYNTKISKFNNKAAFEVLKTNAFEFISWVEGLKKKFKVILLVANYSLPNWSSFCLRKGIQYFFLCKLESKSNCNTFEVYYHNLGTEQKKKSFYIFIRNNEKIKGIKTWFLHRDIENYIHIKENSIDDNAKLIRLIKNKTIGLWIESDFKDTIMLKGAIQAIIDMSIPIDYIVSSGCASIYCSLLASQKSLKNDKEVATLLKKIENKSLTKSQLIESNLSKTKNKYLKKIFKDQKIEDLPINLTLLSSNIINGEIVAHRKGDLTKAVNAATAVPFLFSPQYNSKNEICIDGTYFLNIKKENLKKSLNLQGQLIKIIKYTTNSKNKSYQPCKIKKLMNQFKISSEKEKLITNKDILELFLYSQRVIEKSSEQTKIINLYHSEKTYVKKDKDIIMQKEAYEITQSNLKEFFNK